MISCHKYLVFADSVSQIIGNYRQRMEKEVGEL